MKTPPMGNTAVNTVESTCARKSCVRARISLYVQTTRLNQNTKKNVTKQAITGPVYACTVLSKLDPDEVEVGVVARRLPIIIFTGLAPLSEIRICYCFTMRDIARMLCFKVTFYCNLRRSTRYNDDIV